MSSSGRHDASRLGSAESDCAQRLHWRASYLGFDNAGSCGTCFVITGAKGSAKVMVKDWCPQRDCNASTPHFDLTNSVQAAVAGNTGPKIVSYMRVSCDIATTFESKSTSRTSSGA
jgi:hypothetical protein